MSWTEARARFPVLERDAYLNAGSFGPLSRATGEAIAAWNRRSVDEGRAGEYFEGMFALRGGARTKLASLLGVDESRLALTQSTNEACNIVMSGLELGAEDEIVTSDAEHFGLVGPLAASPARIRVAQVRDRPAAEALDAILAEVTPRTRLVALSHVLWLTGNVLPLTEVREATGVPILVDGAQSVGAIDVGVSAFDFYTVSSQKWLCAPDSTGALYVREPEGLRLRAPSYFSQQDYDLRAATFVPADGAARFDTGWIPPASLAGLEAALTDLPDGRYERARELAERCRSRLAERFEVATAEGQGTLVSFVPDGDPEETAKRLAGEGVVVRHLPGTPWVRVSCGWWNDEEDLERLLAGLG